jgi:hypothetical protein
MQVTVFITIDTEEDLWSDYRKTNNPVDNISCLPKLQALFDRYGAIPTYLINYPVATNDEARKILLEIFDGGRCEIGSHCHPWNTPPFEKRIDDGGSMMCNLSFDVISRKMETLHKAIIERFNITPKCFRAGRWGFGADVARCIQELGYRVDTSVTPFIDWADDGGPNYVNAATLPYRFVADNVLNENPEGPLLEVPPTVGFLQKNFNACNSLRQRITTGPLSRFHFLGILDALRMLNLRWLSPEQNNGPGLIRLSQIFVKKGHPFLNMSFHSNSMLPGANPFVKTEQQLRRFLDHIEMFLSYALKNNMKFAPLSRAFELIK